MRKTRELGKTVEFRFEEWHDHLVVFKIILYKIQPFNNYKKQM